MGVLYSAAATDCDSPLASTQKLCLFQSNRAEQDIPKSWLDNCFLVKLAISNTSKPAENTIFFPDLYSINSPVGTL